eukprot:TRINITY_DN29493_c0_g1_i1.p1 TRINITY_DN29493_c0_g1~~TRINITY_DN29493_c0_g1_i1.p1  ORF type:complete len:1004 (-),score=210.82 TRINITY_DN29493_c0_g1_i1:50-3061(-)
MQLPPSKPPPIPLKRSIRPPKQFTSLQPLGDSPIQRLPLPKDGSPSSRGLSRSCSLERCSGPRRCSSLPSLARMADKLPAPSPACFSRPGSAASRQKADDYARECQKRGVVPMSLLPAAGPEGSPSRPSRRGSSLSRRPSLPSGLAGDAHIAAWCAAGLLDAQEVEVRFRERRVGDEGAEAIARKLGRSTEILDLTGNSVGHRGLSALGRTALPNLRILILAKNSLGDKAVESLIQGLSSQEELRLQSLVLAENQISRSGRAVGSFVARLACLTFVDLHWNFLTGDGALGFFEGVAAHLSGEGHLGRLDVSWNCLGNTGGSASMAALSKALRQESSLVHLDLSYNSLRCQDCQVLAEGLRDNHSLIGLHLVGNAASVDADGFVVAASSDSAVPASGPPTRSSQAAQPELLAQRTTPSRKVLISQEERSAIAAAFKRIDVDGSNSIEPHELEVAMKSLGLQATLEEARVLVAKSDSDGNGNLDLEEFTALIETLMVKQRSIEDDAQQRNIEMERERSVLEARTSCWICESWQPVEVRWRGAATAVWLFTSLDNFQRATRLSADSAGSFTCDRMFPPDQIWAILQVDNGTALLPGLPTALLPQPALLRLRQAEGLAEASEPELQFEEVSLIDLGRESPSSSEATPSSTSVVRRAQRAVVCDDPNNPGQPLVAPRITESEYRAKKQKAPWCFAKSIFAGWRFETDKLHKAALLADWQHAKVSKFIKDEAEAKECLEVYQMHYADFLRIYRRCAAQSTNGASSFGVAMTVASELLAAAGVVDERFCRLADVDTMFIAARVREKGPTAKPFVVKASDTVLRFQFLEFLLRVAVARYAKTGEAASPAEALDRLFQALRTEAERESGELKEFLTNFHTEPCDTVLKKHQSLLRSVYSCNSGRFDAPGAEKMMSAKEFEDLLATAGAFNDAFPQREAMHAFALGMQLYPDELFEVAALRMSFLEFLHGLGACVQLRREAGRLHERLEELLQGLAASGALAGFLRMADSKSG